MLTKLRQAIRAVQEAFQLEGTVRTGLRMLAPGYIGMFLPSVRYRVERVVALSASVDADGEPTAVKLHVVVEDEELKPGTKRATPEGQRRIVTRGGCCTWNKRRWSDASRRLHSDHASEWRINGSNGSAY